VVVITVVITRTGDSDDSCNSQGGSNGTNAGDSTLMDTIV